MTQNAMGHEKRSRYFVLRFLDDAEDESESKSRKLARRRDIISRMQDGPAKRDAEAHAIRAWLEIEQNLLNLQGIKHRVRSRRGVL